MKWRDLKNLTVCGGGVTGMVNAILLAQIGHKVSLVETSDALGGLFKSVKVDGWSFDQGLYIPQMTGIDCIDQIFLKSCKINIRSESEKDIAGNVFKKIHNENSQFIDARLLPKETTAKIVMEMIEKISQESGGINQAQDMESYFKNRFGTEAVSFIYDAISQRFWRRDLKSLSSIALKVVHMPRLVMFNQEVSRTLKDSHKYFDDRVAYPDQLKIPQNFIEGKTSSIYPKKFGLFHLVDGLTRMINNLDIEVRLNTKIESIKTSGSKIVNVGINQAGVKEVISTDGVLWCGATEALHRILGFKAEPLLDKSIPHRTHYVICKTKPKAGRVYWSWDFDENNVIRISFPHNYSCSLDKDKKYLVMVEAHDDPKMSESEFKVWLVSYLESIGLTSRGDITHVYSPESSKRQFFVPSLRNIKRDSKIVSDIGNRDLVNLYFCSAKISDGIFYLHDLLKDSHERISDLLEMNTWN